MHPILIVIGKGFLIADAAEGMHAEEIAEKLYRSYGSREAQIFKTKVSVLRVYLLSGLCD